MDTGRDCEDDFIRLMHEGVIVRPMKLYGFPTSLRATIGRHEDNEKFLEGLTRVARMPRAGLRGKTEGVARQSRTNSMPLEPSRGLAMPDLIQTILETCKTLAVVGLSSKPSRPSYGVSSYMQSHGYRVIPRQPQ